MNRDELATTAQETTVTEWGVFTHRQPINSSYPSHVSQSPATISSNSTTASSAANSSLSPTLHRDTEQLYQGTNGSSNTGSKFFSSYDPAVGINTATVLGGILLVLVIYVVYRTKCRTKILALMQQCTMRYFPDEFPPPSERGSIKKSREPFNSEESEWLSENAKMIWQERSKLANDAENPACFVPGEERAPIRQQADDRTGPTCGECDQCEGEDQAENIAIDIDSEALTLRLPETEEDITLATAHWIQNVKDMDPKERQLNGLILKIPPDLVSQNAKVRSQFHSVTDYCETGEFVNISNRNKSLPLLIEQTSFLYTYANDRRCADNSVSIKRFKKKNNIKNNNNNNINRGDYAPLATQDDFESDIDLRPHQLEVNGQTGSKVPLDLCPIVRVQHFHPRSKRRHTSLCRNSSEESTTSGEECVVANNVAKPHAAAAQAKYIRLQSAHPGPMDNFGAVKVPIHAKNNGARHPNNYSQKVYPASELDAGL